MTTLGKWPFTLVLLTGACLLPLLTARGQPPTTPAATNRFNEKTIRQWTLQGPLGETPKRLSESLPLSDQQNRRHWVKFEPMWDEFEGAALDTNKWIVGMSWWRGRQPAWFNPTNVSVGQGRLHLTMRKESVPKEMEKHGYRDYTSAALHTRARSSYGYYEVKARAMNSAGSSSFWFQQEDRAAHPGWATEVDVFELCGKHPGHEQRYYMTLHVTQTPQEKRHWSVGSSWTAPWRFADDFHVFGFEWGRKELRWYVDGVLVRTVQNTHWHQPLFLIFDSETMPEWFGLPNDADLPSTFSIEYVRAWTGSESASAPKPASAITVASYYFGQYHPNDPRNAKEHGPGWSEWELVKAAQPRFPGHPQPKVPLWGYEDESDPRVMARKIAAAADHGIHAFIFDWYHFDDGPFLDRPINEGFLKATNHHRLKFAFMWANHDWIKNLFPYKKGDPQTVLYPGKVTPANFERIGDHLIKDYFNHPSYWKIDGKPYFSFYDLTRLLENFGSVPATRASLDKFRAKAKAAGLEGLHLNAVAWGQTILPGAKAPLDTAQLVRDLGFDSVTSYVWLHHAALPQQATDYDVVRDAYFAYCDKATAMFDVPYFPNITMGWDPSPRCDQSVTLDNSGYPFTNTIKDNTPERFRAALEMAKRRLLTQKNGPRILNINCWNEWTEGSYLEPDTANGMKYLEAVREVFGPVLTK